LVDVRRDISQQSVTLFYAVEFYVNHPCFCQAKKGPGDIIEKWSTRKSARQ
jgi:hypothetical protein